MSDQPGFAEGHPLTVADLESMPDDGRRYELIDGTLFVTPGPTWTHGRKHELIDGLLSPSSARSPSPCVRRDCWTAAARANFRA